MINRKRVLLLSGLIFFLYSILIAQFFRIQILDGEKWSRIADRQHYFTITEPFIRGSFYSNTFIKRGHIEKPQKIVFDIQKFHLFIDPSSIRPQYRHEIVKELLERINFTKREKERLISQFRKKSRSRKIASWVDPETKKDLMRWWLPYARKRKIPTNALYTVSVYQRSYPFGKLLGQVLHTVQMQRDETTKQAIPTGGLELYFNEFLKGSLGKRKMMRSPKNRFETGQVIVEPKNGANIYLTVNHYLQAIAEEELAKGVKKAKAKAGWAVMMDPFTGEILALAQYPFFYPEKYQSYFNSPDMILHTYVKAVTDALEPGSTMKPITLAAALKANQELIEKGEDPLFDLEEKIAVIDGMFPGRKRPIKDVGRHKFLNTTMAMQKSSNIYFAKLAERIIDRLDAHWYRQFLYHIFGFGRKTGIELPAESAGVLPVPGKTLPGGYVEWSKSTPFSLAIGHNIQTTSIQMVRAFAVLANGGYLVKPTLIKKIVSSDGRVLFDESKREKPIKVLNREIVKNIYQTMRFTALVGGTAKRAKPDRFTVIGKTGTSKKIVKGEYSDKHTLATFIGYVPEDKPAFVLFIAVDEPEPRYIPGVGKNHHGGVCAAPIFKKISQRSLAYLGVTPNDPNEEKYQEERKRLKQIYDKWNK